MKNVLLPLMLFIVAASVLFSRSLLAEDAKQAVAYQHLFEAFSPRLEGSAGSQATFDFITQKLSSKGIRFTTSDFSNFENGYSFSKIVSVTIPGKRPDTLVFAVPVNQPPDAVPGRDGSVNLAAALALAERYHTQTPPLTLRFLFLGAEFPRISRTMEAGTESSSYPLGTKLFLQDYFPDHPVAVIYLDLKATTSSLAIEPGGGNLVAPLWLVRGAMQAATAAGQQFTIAQNRIIAFRLGRADTNSQITPYLRQDIPAIALESSGGTSVAAGGAEWYETFFGFIGRFLDAHAQGFSTSWDRHYLLWDIDGHYLFFAERTELLFLLVIVALTLLYVVASRHRIRRYARTFLRNFWNLLLLLALMFGFLLAATVLVQLFLSSRDFPSLWQHSPLMFFGWKLALTLFLSALSYRVIRRLPISRNGSFYSAAAVVVLFVDVLIAAFINIAFVIYFLFAFIASFLFSISRYRWLKMVLLVIAPLLLVKATWDALTIPETLLVQAMLLSPINGNLLLAFVTLPFVLMGMRVDFLIRHPVRGRASFTSFLTMLVTAAASIVMGILLLMLSPYNERHPQRVSVQERIDTASGRAMLVLESPAPLRNLSFRYGARTITLHNSGRRYKVELPTQPPLLHLDRTYHTFLGRAQTTLTLSPIPDPNSHIKLYRVSALLSELKPMIVYDLNFPFTYSANNRQVTIHIGADPPDPLVVDYILPSGRPPVLSVKADFLGLPVSCTPVTPGYTFVSTTSVLTVLGPDSGG